MRIAILNVKYSPNLGDGLLSECLEAELIAQHSDVVAKSIDLAGRRDYGAATRNRRVLLALLDRMPHWLRARTTGYALRRLVANRLAPLCREAFSEADAIVLGGGNLLADVDLNFPIKIACALGEAAKSGRPVGVFAVGVSDNWSAKGKTLFRNAFAATRLVHAAVRDERSRNLWNGALRSHGIMAAQLCRDPGLLAACHYPSAASVALGRARVGLCLTHPLALRYHGGQADSRLDSWLVDLAKMLVQRGLEVVLFTNGSPEDRVYLGRVESLFRAACGGAVTTEPGFARPADLARFISSCSVVIAHRMHACIAAYSFAVPHVGLTWDPKLDSFFASVGRSEYMLDPVQCTPDEGYRLACQALEEGIDVDSHAVVVAEARAGVRALYTDLAGALAE